MLLARLKVLAKATIYLPAGKWVKSVVLDPKRRDLIMDRDIGPNRCTLHSALMICD